MAPYGLLCTVTRLIVPLLVRVLAVDDPLVGRHYPTPDNLALNPDDWTHDMMEASAATCPRIQTTR